MNYNKYIWVLILFCMACASPSKSFRKGNFEKAYTSALKELNKGDDVRQNKGILSRSFSEMLKDLDALSREISSASALEERERLYFANKELIKHYDDGRRYLPGKFDGKIADLRQENIILRQDLAEGYRIKGLDEMDRFDNSRDKRDAQNAHYAFLRARDFGSEFDDLEDLLEESYDEGLIHVLVETDSWDRRMEWEIDNTFRDVINYSEGFQKIHYENALSEADCRIEINFNNIDVAESVNTLTENFSREIQDGYDTVKDSNGNTVQVPRYINVRGTVRTFVRTRKYNWRMMTNIRKMGPYCDFRENVFQAEEYATVEDYELSGDIRAIPDRYRNYIRTDFRDQENRIIDHMIDELYREFTRYYFR